MNENDFISTSVRLPVEIHAEIKQQARLTSRSWNSMLVVLLRKQLDMPVEEEGNQEQGN